MFDGESVSTEPMRSNPCHSGSSRKRAGILRVILHAEEIAHRVDVFVAREAVVGHAPARRHAAPPRPPSSAPRATPPRCALSSAAGRVFTFFGGISPELMRSMISSHCGVFSKPTFGESVSIRKSPFCFSAPWQLTQCFSTNGCTTFPKSRGSAACNAAETHNAQAMGSRRRDGVVPMVSAGCSGWSKSDVAVFGRVRTLTGTSGRSSAAGL